MRLTRIRTLRWNWELHHELDSFSFISVNNVMNIYGVIILITLTSCTSYLIISHQLDIMVNKVNEEKHGIGKD